MPSCIHILSWFIISKFATTTTNLGVFSKIILPLKCCIFYMLFCKFIRNPVCLLMCFIVWKCICFVFYNLIVANISRIPNVFSIKIIFLQELVIAIIRIRGKTIFLKYNIIFFLTINFCNLIRIFKN